MKKIIFIAFISVFIFSCEKEERNTPENNLSNINARYTAPNNEITFKLKPYSIAPQCVDGNYSVNDFQIIFSEPTTENLDFNFNIRKHSGNYGPSVLVADVSSVFIPTGSTTVTVPTSCELSSAVDCEYNGTNSQNFYIRFAGNSYVNSNHTYSTNDFVTITAYRYCQISDDDDENGPGGSF